MKLPYLLIVVLLSVQTAICGVTEWPYTDSDAVEDLLSKRFPPCKGSAGGNSGSDMKLNTRIFRWDRSSYVKTAMGEIPFFIKTFESLGYEVVEQGCGRGGATDSVDARKLKFKLRSDNEEIVLFVISQHTVSKTDDIGFVSIYWCCNVESK